MSAVENNERQPLLGKVGNKQTNHTQNGNGFAVNGKDATHSGPCDNLPSKSDSSVTAVFKRRWYILAVFSLGSFMQALGWNTWGPITQSAEQAFGWANQDIGMLANYGNIASIVATIPLCYLMDVKGLRLALIISALMIFAGCAIRCVSMHYTAIKWTANIGAVLLGFGSVVPFAGPARVSSVWFPPGQRATATSLISFVDQVGLSMGFIIGPLMVQTPKYRYTNTSSHQEIEEWGDYSDSSNTSNSSKVLVNNATLISDIRHYMYLHAGIAAILLVLVFVYFPDKPSKPPSASAGLERTEWKKGLRTLAKNKAFWLVILAGSIPTGVLGVWANVLDVNLKPHGVTQDQAGYMGFWQTIAGCTSGLIIARFSDMFMKRMKLFLLVLFIGASLCVAWFTAMSEKYIPFNIPSLYAACILIGIFVNGGFPLVYEISCEASYPVSEGVTGGVLTLMNELVGVLFLCIMLIRRIGTSWMDWALLGSTVVALPLLCLFPERYRRTDLDITIVPGSSVRKRTETSILPEIA